MAVKKVKRRAKTVSQKEALRIVRKHLIEMVPRDFEIQDGPPEGCILYGISGDRPCWSVRIPSKHIGFGPSHYICICRKTGRIIFDGFAGE